MKAIDGNLKIDTTYKMISSEYVGLEGGCACENCNLQIATLCTIQDEAGKQFIVGSDCAEGLVSKDGRFPLEWWKAKQVMKLANQTKSYIAKLQKAKRENRLKITDTDFVIYDKPITDPKTIWSIRLFRNSTVGRLFDKINSKTII